jgi:hypothetical protein
MTQVLLLLAPALLLAAVLAFGRYPGAAVLTRALERRRPRRRVRPVIAAPRVRPAQRRRPRGGALLALALAGRAPPEAVA